MLLLGEEFLLDPLQLLALTMHRNEHRFSKCESAGESADDLLTIHYPCPGARTLLNTVHWRRSRRHLR